MPGFAHTTPMKQRIYIDVIVLFKPDGTIRPLSIVWKGTEYLIDRIVYIDKQIASDTGGSGQRYTVEIEGKRRYLYFVERENRWFVEVNENISI